VRTTVSKLLFSPPPCTSFFDYGIWFQEIMNDQIKKFFLVSCNIVSFMKHKWINQFEHSAITWKPKKQSFDNHSTFLRVYLQMYIVRFKLHISLSWFGAVRFTNAAISYAYSLQTARQFILFFAVNKIDCCKKVEHPNWHFCSWQIGVHGGNNSMK
jgi:hypothetical protein